MEPSKKELWKPAKEINSVYCVDVNELGRHTVKELCKGTKMIWIATRRKL